MTAIQQILFTDRGDEWRRIAEALGFSAPYPPSPEWAEFHGGGSFALHRVMDDHPAGSVDLHVLVDDLDHAERALAAFRPDRFVMEGVGETLAARIGGISFTVGEGSAGGGGAVAVQPIVFAPDLADLRTALEALGVRPVIASESGGWVELATDGGGSLGLHHAEEPRVGLSFLSAEDPDALAARLREEGFAAAVIDEAFGRTVRLPDPDGGEGVWINEVQTDLHGYRPVG
ncbi:hypothetical protein [Microbacterium sp. gxy059]|uniref:hypothetical protein n=1 Tax=Microbacterium sp. gxy059 TaxID=2957199 RepID=UPI003D97B73A